MFSQDSVIAAPNRCSIRAKVLDLRQSSKYSDKWHFSLIILASSPIEGPNFARIGNQVAAFTFEAFPKIFQGDAIEAEAEYIGGAKVGQFQLFSIKVKP